MHADRWSIPGSCQWLGAMVLSVSSFACGATSQPLDTTLRPTHVIHQTLWPVVVDGQLDDAAWAGALVFDRFVEVGREADQTPPPTLAKLLYDKQSLLISFRCEEWDVRPDCSQVGWLSEAECAATPDVSCFRIPTEACLSMKTR